MAHGTGRRASRGSQAASVMRVRTRRTGMLASVTSLAEAKLALGADVDIIDLKDPTSGALGALPVAVGRDVVTWIGGRKPVSATIGDVTSGSADQLRHSIAATAACGVDYVKVGF